MKLLYEIINTMPCIFGVHRWVKIRSGEPPTTTYIEVCRFCGNRTDPVCVTEFDLGTLVKEGKHIYWTKGKGGL